MHHTMYTYMYMFLMRDEKEERKKQARSNKQIRQSNTAHMYMINAVNIWRTLKPRNQWWKVCAWYIHVHVLCVHSISTAFQVASTHK